ncbi:MAG: phytanoyl-CoA dioxygenase family protein [Pseudomonadales bacterium]
MKNLASNDYIDQYQTQGFAIIRNLFSHTDISALATAFDHLKDYASQFSGSYRHQNQLYVFQTDEMDSKLLRFVRWPSYSFPTFEKFRADQRIFDVLEPMIGQNIKQITNQAIWKSPGDRRTSYSFHQDAYWRKPVNEYRELAKSYVQTAIAIDPHGEFNGGLKMVAGSHRKGNCYQHSGSVMTNNYTAESLDEYGLKENTVVPLEMSPGDAVIWHPYLFHGSGPNLSNIDRRLYINGYVAAAHCDRGEYAFRHGKPVPLGEPSLVDYDDLYTRPQPHYI